MLEEEIESPTEKIIQALAVGKLNDEAFGSVGIYNDNGIFWDMPNSQSNKFVIIVSNIDRFNDRYICDVMGGPDNKQFQDFGNQDFSIENMPAQYDFDDIVHNASSKYGVKLGSMNGFRNALDAHNNIVSSYEIGENKINNRYTKRQILESIKYWQKQLNRIDESSDVSETWIHASTRDFSYAPEDPWLYVTQTNDCFVQPTRKIGCSRTDGPSGESFKRKLARYSTSTNAGWKPAYQLVFPKEEYSSSIFAIEREFDKIVIKHGGSATGANGGGRQLFAIDDAKLYDAIAEFQEKYPEMEVYAYVS